MNAAPEQVAQNNGMPPAEFGSPPSGEVPILFNDQHVYSKPAEMKQNRALAAIVRGSTVLVPLRSMFEQMGATVSYDPESKTVDVSKPGADIKVTVGQKEVVINGESRPLDVAPEMYKGTVVVPVRVISEGMGAYVQWVPSKRVVVVRYVPPPPPPAPKPAPAKTAAPAPKPTVKPPPPPAPKPPPTPAPLPPETPTPTPVSYDKFIAADYLLDAKNKNEFVGGARTSSSYAARAAIELPFIGETWMIEGDYRNWSWTHPAGAVTPIGGGAAVATGAFAGTNQDLDGRIGLRVFTPRFYIAGSYIGERNNYGYPSLNGVGFGAEALPNLNRPSSLYGSYYYYPNVSGNFTLPSGASGTLAYHLQRYAIGYTWNIKGPSWPLFFDFGVMGEGWTGKTNAPATIINGGVHAGLGLHF